MHHLLACKFFAHVSVLTVTQGLSTVLVALRLTFRVLFKALIVALTFVLEHARRELKLLSILCQVTLLLCYRLYHSPACIRVVSRRQAVLSLHLEDVLADDPLVEVYVFERLYFWAIRKLLDQYVRFGFLCLHDSVSLSLVSQLYKRCI